MKCLFPFLLVLCAANPIVMADLVFSGEPAYHGATRSAVYNEKWPEDRGGVLYCFVTNNGPQPDAVAGLRINGGDVAAHQAVSWWRAWPPVLSPGETGWIAVKATGAPLEQGASAEITLVAGSGTEASVTARCATPALRLANALPSPDYRALLIYLRNDGKAPLMVDRVLLNSAEMVPGVSAELSAAGGAYGVAPGAVLILRAERPQPMPLLHPLALRVRGSDEDGVTVWTGAGLRLTEAHFTLGTWSSDMIKEPAGQRYARRLGIDACVSGADWERQEAMFANYHIRTLNIVNHEAGDPPVKEPNLDLVRARTDADHIAAWMVRDEPDLHSIPAARMFDHNMRYWNNDPGHPTYLNLMTMAGYNEYGHIPDIVCMDHYVMFAPNAIPRTGVTRHARMEEAIEYTDLLKDNTEPVRMWVWPQLSAPVWGRQPHPWGVDYQFWAHIMGGAKGLLWFKYGPGYEEKYPEQTAAGERLVRMFNPVRTLCFYGEPLRNLGSDNEKVLGRTLVSEDAVLAVVLNNNYEAGGVPFRSSYSIKSAAATLTVPVPAWVNVEKVVRVTAGGFEPVAHETGADGVRIRAELREESHVYLIGRNDTAAPGPVTGVVVADHDDTGTTLSWPAVWDNYGVMGYTVFLDGGRHADTPFPFFTATIPGAYSVQAHDASGNAGGMSAPVPVAF